MAFSWRQDWRRGSSAAVLVLLIGCSSDKSTTPSTGGTPGSNGGQGGSIAGTSSGGMSTATGGTTASTLGGNTQGGASGGSTPTTSGGTSATGGTSVSAGASSGGSTQAGASQGGGGAQAGGGAGGTSGASAGGATSAGSGGGGTPVELKIPIERSGKYVLEFGDVTFSVDPMIGARIASFALGGKSTITGQDTDTKGEGNWGSTYWPSPQSTWGWPPIPELDKNPYTPSVTGNTVTMVSAVAAGTNKLSLTKKFTPVLDAQAVDVEYVLKNEASQAVSWAPWEISRVPSGGLAFFPTGTKVVPVTSTDPLPTAKIVNQAGVSWYQSSAADKGKYNADGAEGWLAYASGDLLYIKRFEDIPADKAAPGEADVEIYAGGAYVELEPQGAYQSMPAQGTLSWKVRWYVRKLSDTSIVKLGNADLLALVREVIKK
ncbi:MAG TPA: hypothetical protein VFQ61_05670 [Polyangiaceae bacterium]|nr:hypothetical protein [Polyangiaceae bacterium]